MARDPREISPGSDEIDPEFLDDDEAYTVDDWVALYLEDQSEEMWERIPEEAQEVVERMRRASR